MSSITKTMTPSEAKALKDSYPSYEEKKTPPYAFYRIKVNTTTITAYESGKVVFQDKKYETKQKETTSNFIFPQAGSDEVGTGDYFGPVVVCACYLSEEDALTLKDYKIQDSKQIKDSDILTLGPILTKQCIHSLLVLDNTKYNQIHDFNNMNAIKAKMHNQAFIHLQKKLGTLPTLNVIDQFATPSTYYKYLKDEGTIIKNLQFETKAENKFMAVACAAIIARYHFLIAFQQMNQYFDFNFPKGAGTLVDQAIKDFVDKYGQKELTKVAKLHFLNTKKALSTTESL